MHQGRRPAADPWARTAPFVISGALIVANFGLLILLEYLVYAHWVWLYESFDPSSWDFRLHGWVLNSVAYVVGIMWCHYALWSWIAEWRASRENWAYLWELQRNIVAYVTVFIIADGYMWSIFIGLIHIPLIEYFGPEEASTFEFPLFGRLLGDSSVDTWVARHDATIIAMLSVNQVRPARGSQRVTHRASSSRSVHLMPCRAAPLLSAPFLLSPTHASSLASSSRTSSSHSLSLSAPTSAGVDSGAGGPSPIPRRRRPGRLPHLTPRAWTWTRSSMSTTVSPSLFKTITSTWFSSLDMCPPTLWSGHSFPSSRG